MAAVIAVLGAGPHGRQLAALHDATLYDDELPGYRPVIEAQGPYLIGAAWPHVRRGIAAKTQGVPHERGVVVFPGARIGHDVELGEHTHVGWNAVVSHGCRVGAFVNICPGAVLAGDVTVDDDVFIGAAAVIIHGGIKVGVGALIGAGAVVLSDVPAGATVAGNPARLL